MGTEADLADIINSNRILQYNIEVKKMKNTMKRALTLMLAAALLTAVGCKQEEEKKIPVIPNVNTETPAATPSKSAESTTPPAPSEPAQPEVQDEVLNEFYNIIEDSQRACAVAYLGYTEGPLGDGYGAWFEENGLLDVYPFLNDLPTERIIEQDGGEVYCIIPRQAEVEISVYSQNFDADGAVSVGDELFHSTDCQPFLVRGNISEIVPNTAVSIEYADGSSVEFSPALSGMDGRLALTEDQGIFGRVGEPRTPPHEAMCCGCARLARRNDARSCTQRGDRPELVPQHQPLRLHRPWRMLAHDAYLA